MNKSNAKIKISIPPIGLINLSRVNQYTKNDFIDENNSNLYNICYLNSSIQCLFHLDEFIYELLKASNYHGKILFEATINLLYKMIDENKKNDLSTSEIKEAIGKVNDIYKEDNQEDAFEFILNYLNALVEETADKSKDIQIKLFDKNEEDAFKKFYARFYKRKGSSFILDLFYGILRKYNICPICGNKTVKYHAYNIIELPIYDFAMKNKKKKLKMKNILDNYFLDHPISEFCQNCGNSSLNSQTQIYTVPKCVIIYFSRNLNNYIFDNNIELLDKINISDYMYSKAIDKKKDYNYNLKSVIYYSKIGEYGHYSSSCLYNKEWYHVDDNDVEYDDKNENRKPTILFYEN